MKNTKKEHVKKIIITVLAVIIFAEIVGFGWFLYLNAKKDTEEKYYSEYMAKIKEYETIKDNEGIEKLAEINTDFVAWVKCEDVNISMPVVQSTDYDNREYYLKHNFEKKDSSFGCPYLKYECDINTSDNLTLVGHSSFIGGVVIFSEFYKYLEDQQNCFDYKIELETLQGKLNFEIFSAFEFNANNDSFDGSFVYNATMLTEDETFNKFVDICTTKSVLKRDVELEIQDKFLTIITCSKRNLANRVLIVAKQILCMR